MGYIERPLGVTILSAILIIGSIVTFFMLIGIPIFWYGASINFFLENPILKILFIYSIIMIPLTILLAIGLLKGWDGARVITIIFYFISIISSLIIISPTSFFSIFISLIVIYYLTRPHVKDFFYGIQSRRY